MKYIDKLALVEIQHRKVLLVRTKGVDLWFMPGGKRERGEIDIEALAREIKEEIAIEIVPETSKFYGVFQSQAHGKPAGVEVRITCYTAGYQGDIRPSSEIAEYAWVSSSDRGLFTETGKLIIADLKKKDLID